MRVGSPLAILVALTVAGASGCAETLPSKIALSQGAARCLCHNDVHSLNIVDNGTLRLIDWEYSGIGEPMFDLASICVYHRYARPDRERLLDAYVTSASSNAAHQLELACWLFEYVKDLWTEVRGASA